MKIIVFVVLGRSVDFKDWCCDDGYRRPFYDLCDDRDNNNSTRFLEEMPYTNIIDDDFLQLMVNAFEEDRGGESGDKLSDEIFELYETTMNNVEVFTIFRNSTTLHSFC